MKDESQQQIPPNIVAFMGHHGTVGRFDSQNPALADFQPTYNSWVHYHLMQPPISTIHTISVDEIEWSCEEVTPHGKINHFEWSEKNKRWVAFIEHNNHVMWDYFVDNLSKLPPPSLDRSGSQLGKEDTPEELAEKFIEHTDITDRKECWLAGYHFAQESQPSQLGEGKEWKPMNLAPKDGTEIIMSYDDKGEDVTEAYWAERPVCAGDKVYPEGWATTTSTRAGKDLPLDEGIMWKYPDEPPLPEQGKEEAFGGKEVTILDLVEEKRKLQWRIVDLKEEIAALKSRPSEGWSGKDMIHFATWFQESEVEWNTEGDNWLIAGKQTLLTDGRNGFIQHYDSYTDEELIEEFKKYLSSYKLKQTK